MSIWKDHSQGLLMVLLIPISIGCSSQHSMTDWELSEQLKDQTSDRPAKIRFTDGKEVDGYLLEIRHDSLLWQDALPAASNLLLGARAEDVYAVYIRTHDVNHIFWMGLGGCAIGGCTGLTYQIARMYDGAKSDSTPILVGALAGAGVGTLIGSWANSMEWEDVWAKRISNKSH